MTEQTPPPPQDPPGPPPGVRQIDVQMSTGRFIGIAAPVDLTDDELLELIAWMANRGGFIDTLRPPSPIITPPQFQRPLS